MAFGRKAQLLQDQRTGPRAPVEIVATARLPVGEPVEIRIEELSVTGFRAVIPLPLRPGMLFRVGLPSGRCPHVIVVHQQDDDVGCAFVAPLDPLELAILTGG